MRSNGCWKLVELFRKGGSTAQWNFAKMQVARIILHQILISPKYVLRCHRSAHVKSKFGNSQQKGFLIKKNCLQSENDFDTSNLTSKYIFFNYFLFLLEYVFKQINFYFLLSPWELTLCDLLLLVCINTYQQSHKHHDGFHQKICTFALTMYYKDRLQELKS